MNEIDMDSDLSIRTCASCACHSVIEDKANPLQTQMFCRRDPPMAQQMRVDRPVIRDGKPVMQRDGKTPLMQPAVEIAYMFKPTLSTLVCFDGWRPLGTDPGQRGIDSIDNVSSALKRLWSDMIVQQQEESLRQPEPADFSVGAHVNRDGDVHGGELEDCDLCNLLK